MNWAIPILAALLAYLIYIYKTNPSYFDYYLNDPKGFKITFAIVCVLILLFILFAER